MKLLRRAFRNPAPASFFLAIAVFAITALVRELGLLQTSELLVYDKCLTWRGGAEATDPRIVVVEITESDIGKYDFPIPDNLLAQCLETIAAAKPLAIGLDLYRDVAEPRDGSQLAELNRVLRQNQNIVGIFKFGNPQHPVKIPVPPGLADSVSRYGFNDFPFELGAVRRAFLLWWDDENNIYPSFALALALQTGIDYNQEGSDFCVGKTNYPRFRSNEGGYVRAKDAGHQFLLDFKSPRKFETFSLDDVLAKRADEHVWRGKIVLIGEGAESAHDFATTPLQASLPGVELNAQTLNQILRGSERGDKPTRSWREAAELAWIFFWCMAGAATGFFFRRPTASLSSCCSCAAAIAAICWIAFTRDLWLPFVPALGGNLTAAAAVIGYTRHHERKDRDTLMRIFSQHVSPAIADSMWTHRDEFMDGSRPRPQKLLATVLFTDFRNFSTASEDLQPAEVMEWVNDYMQSLARHIETHDGFINKYMGDAIMAVFGFPQALTPEADIRRDAFNAVHAALEMGNEMRRLNKAWEKMGRSPVQMRVGIFSGPAVAGCIGSTDRLEFTVMGDTVNTAARLESFDKDYGATDACRILIGDSTFDLIEGKFSTEFVQTIELKGQEQENQNLPRLGGANVKSAGLRAVFRKPAIATLALSVVVFTFVAAAREAGLLQSAEFLVYDKALAWRAGPETTDPRIVIVEITESDISKYDFPVPDHLLAQLLQIILAAKPIIIGLDIYRDVPVPRDASQLAKLTRVLRENQNIVGIFKFGTAEHPIKVSFAPPLAEPSERYGFNDLPFELGAVRRGFLFLWDSQDHVYTSFPLALALHMGVVCSQEGTEFHMGKATFRRFRSNDGPYIRAQDGGHQFLLDFRSPRKFLTYSLDDVLSERSDQQVWHNKIVLIGEGAESAHDFATTPLQANVPGVELNAQILNQLLRAAERGEKLATSWPEIGEVGWIFAWCLIGGASSFLIRRPFLSLATCFALTAALAAMCWIAFTHSFWLPFLPALVGSGAAAAIVTGYLGYLERKERETLMQLFSQNVSPAIADSIWKHREEFIDGHRPRPQKLLVSVLFTDFQNFAGVSEKLQPGEAMDWVNEYLEALARQVERHSGVVDKYMGDAIMAVFGFPLALTVHADVRKDACNAVSCALAMRRELRRLNDAWKTRGRPPVRVRVGIFSGPAVAGCIGSSERLEFTMIGDTVNTAERLQSFDKEYGASEACRILIGQPTLELLERKFATEFVQTIKLKGKAEMTTIHSVLGSTL